jgi:transposase
MTPEEKQLQQNERDAAICRYYGEGHKLSETSRRFKLGRQLVLRILKRNGVWRPYVKTDRTSQVGVAVSDETKQGLKSLAKERGISMSRLGSEIIDEYVREGNGNNADGNNADGNNEEGKGADDGKNDQRQA